MFLRKKRFYITSFSLNWITCIYYGCFVVLLFLCIVNICTEFFISQHKENQAFAIFPFFVTQKSVFQKSTKLSETQQHFFRTLYHNYPDVLIQKLQNTELKKNDPQRVQIISDLYQIDPWQRLYYDNLEYYDERKDEQHLEQELDDIQQFFTKQFSDDYSREEMRLGRNEYFARFFVKATQQLSQKNDVEKISRYLHFAQRLDEWALARLNPIFFSGLTLEQLEQLHKELSDIPVGFFGDYRGEYARSLENVFMTQFQNDPDSMSKNEWMITRSIEMAPWTTNDFCKAFILRNLGTSNLGTVQKTIKVSQKMISLSHANKDIQLTDENQDLFRLQYQHYFDVLNASPNSIQKMHQTIHFIESVHQDFPEYLNSTNYWFLHESLSEEQSEQFIRSLDVKKLPPDSVIAKYYEKICLLKAQKLILEGNVKGAEEYVQKMYDAAPYDYWTNAQLGNYYILAQERQKAQDIFQSCKQKFTFVHDDCESGLRLTQNTNAPLTDAFFQRNTQIMLKFLP